jgi:hypothetical protein
VEWPDASLSMGTTPDSDPSCLDNLSSLMLEIFGPKIVPDLAVKYYLMEQRGLL